MKHILTYLIIFTSVCSNAQDSTQLDRVDVKQDATLPVSVEVVTIYSFKMLSAIYDAELNRYNNTSILPAVNTIPGVRMEERSPGSYRFGIRGSAAGSPFGVRNIKVYYNDIPFTDAGGNTYLNNLGFYNIGQLSVKKGPSGSLYGAGIGGVVFIGSLPQETEDIAKVHYTTGSYGLQSASAELFINNNSDRHAIRYQHVESDGYRSQSALKKDVFSYDVSTRTSERNELEAHFLYTDLSYQTPGGLTLAQYNADPTSARPATPTIPGAADNKATIYQQAFLTGITNKLQISNKWQNKTTLFASYNQLTNPTIRNYSISAQPNVGGRTAFEYNTNIGRSHVQWITGAELLTQSVTEKTYRNNSGTPGTLTNDVGINNTLAFGFTHLEWKLNKFTVLGGLSVNTLNVNIKNFAPTFTEQTKQFNNQLAPRLSLQYQIKHNASVYATAERGYTPPSVSELSPTGSNINLGLQASQGWNYGIGSMGFFFGDRIYYDISLFNFQLSQAIAQRRDSAGGDYYVNSGGANQYGVEALIRYNFIIHKKSEFFKSINTSLAYTGYDFRYKNFTQLTTDYSGNKLPGVPDHAVSASVDADTRIGIYANLTYYYCSSIFLNDANTDRAIDYTLLGGRIGYRKNIKRMVLDVFAGGDNLLDKKYSLGNDINAAGGRYYNAAPGINFFAGLSLGYKYRKPELQKNFNNIMEIRD
jgi:iron complex outermembrane receptor protein